MIVIDYRDHRPIYEQIIDRIKELILKGIMESGSQLPSVRNLAMELSINPNTIQRAYAELERQGFIYSAKGKGSFVADNQKLVLGKRREIIRNIEKLLEEAQLAGITQEEVMEIVFCRFRGGKNND